VERAEHARLADLERVAAGHGVPVRRRARGVSVEYDAAALLLGYARPTSQDRSGEGPGKSGGGATRPNTHAGPGAYDDSGEYKFSAAQGAASGPGATAASLSHMVSDRLRYDTQLDEKSRHEAAEADRVEWEEAPVQEMKEGRDKVGGSREGRSKSIGGNHSSIAAEPRSILGGPVRRKGQHRRSWRASKVAAKEEEGETNRHDVRARLMYLCILYHLRPAVHPFSTLSYAAARCLSTTGFNEYRTCCFRKDAQVRELALTNVVGLSSLPSLTLTVLLRVAPPSLASHLFANAHSLYSLRSQPPPPITSSSSGPRLDQKGSTACRGEAPVGQDRRTTRVHRPIRRAPPPLGVRAPGEAVPEGRDHARAG
jgi:hypothetical protein